MIEDEKELTESIGQYLEEENYFCDVAFDFDSATEKIYSYAYDCILLDLTLPGGDGITILRELKKKNKTVGVIIISAKNSLDSKIEDLSLEQMIIFPNPSIWQS